MKNNSCCNDALVVHLTVGQMKAIVESILKDASLLFTKNVQTEILTIEEVSELTGYKRATIYKLTCERKIPFHKPAHGGRKIFFKREEINQWLQSNSVKTYQMDFENWKDNNNLKKKDL
jgi:excisionase family DNA binding protein